MHPPHTITTTASFALSQHTQTPSTITLHYTPPCPILHRCPQYCRPFSYAVPPSTATSSSLYFVISLPPSFVDLAMPFPLPLQPLSSCSLKHSQISWSLYAHNTACSFIFPGVIIWTLIGCLCGSHQLFLMIRGMERKRLTEEAGRGGEVVGGERGKAKWPGVPWRGSVIWPPGGLLGQ